MKKTVFAMLAILAMSFPAIGFSAMAADEKSRTEARNKEWNVDVPLIQKLAKQKKCKEVVMYREVLPYFGKENTLRASREITTQFEREDLASGRAIILHEKSSCDELLGNFFVMCTTDTALCYFEEPKKIGKGKILGKNASNTRKHKD